MRKILRGQVFNKIFLFTLFVALSFSAEVRAQLAGGTYTINSNFATGGTNFNSFTDAVAALQSGITGSVIFNVQSGSGPYTGQIRLAGNIGTTAGRTLTFNCNGVTLSFLSTNTNERAGVKLDNIDYVTFDNLVINPQAANDGEYGYGFHLLNDADNNVIKNCRINNPTNLSTPGNNEGIVINGNNEYSTDPGSSTCDNNLLEQNTITGGGAGITLNSTPVSGPVQFMLANQIVRNTISGAYKSGIQVYGTEGTVIDANEITNNTLVINDVNGIYLGSANQNVKVTGNRIHDFISTEFFGSLYGINITAQSVAGKVNLVANNLIYNFSSYDVQYGIALMGSASFTNIYNNTISLDDVEYGSITNGLYFQDASDVNVLNNIVTVTRPSSTNNFFINFENDPLRFVCNKNVYYVANSDGTAVAYVFLTEIYSLSAWRTATGFDAASVFLNPQYADLAGFDFRPTAQPIDNMALPVNILNDITGATRDAVNPDPGCFEFISSACSTPVAGTLLVSPDSVLCGGPLVSLNINGNSWGSGQTYTFQTATTINGTYNAISSGLTFPSYSLTPTQTFYYRVAVTCAGNTVYTSPVRILVNTVMAGGTYTINSAQPTGGINFTSFSDASLAMQCGIGGSVIFNVTPGSTPYNEQLIIPAINTTPTRTVTFRGNGATLSFAASNNNERAVIKLNGTDYVTIDSLNINVQGTSFGFGVQLMNNADHNTIKNCKITLSTTANTDGYAGIVINPSANDAKQILDPSNCDSNIIINNTVTGGFYGLTCTSYNGLPGVVSSKGNIIRNNIFLDNYAYGMYLAGNENLVADSNDIGQPTRTTFGNYSGIYIDRSNFGLQISRNRIHNLGAPGKAPLAEFHGIHFEYATATAAAPNMVVNNLLYDFKGLGFQFGLYNISTNYVGYYHNTVSLEDSSATGGTTIGFGMYNALSTGLEFKNNSIVIKRGGSGTRHCIYLFNNDNMVSNYNNLYYAAPVGVTTGPSYVGHRGGTNYSTLTDWRTTGKDANTISMEPGYNDAASGNFLPTKILFDDKGVAAGVATDIENASRSTSAPDIGAYEFTICKPITTPVLSIDSVGLNTVRFAWTGSPNASGYLVSRDGVKWTIPSSGAFGTTHTITGLKSRDTVGLMVKTLGTLDECPVLNSQRLVATTVNDLVFIPNTFSPNGNGKSDVFKVYAQTLNSLHLLVFNQWGEKVFETNDPNGEWNGSYKGKPSPIGVYIYVASMVLADGTKVTQKGSFNLIR